MWRNGWHDSNIPLDRGIADETWSTLRSWPLPRCRTPFRLQPSSMLARGRPSLSMLLGMTTGRPVMDAARTAAYPRTLGTTIAKPTPAGRAREMASTALMTTRGAGSTTTLMNPRISSGYASPSTRVLLEPGRWTCTTTVTSTAQSRPAARRTGTRTSSWTPTKLTTSGFDSTTSAPTVTCGWASLRCVLYSPALCVLIRFVCWYVS